MESLLTLKTKVIPFLVRKRSVGKVPLDRTPNRTLQDLILELEAVQEREESLQEFVRINLLLTIPLKCRLDRSPGWPPLLPYWGRNAPLHAHHPLLYP